VQMSAHNDGVFLYNFCHPQRYTSKDICAAFSQVAGYPQPKLLLPIWALNLIAVGFEMLSRFGFRTDINRARLRKLYQSTNMVPKRLPNSGFQYQYDLPGGLAAWKRSSRVTDFD
jgi:NAD dependent epimerase/dehydratase family enzyme